MQSRVESSQLLDVQNASRRHQNENFMFIEHPTTYTKFTYVITLENFCMLLEKLHFFAMSLERCKFAHMHFTYFLSGKTLTRALQDHCSVII